MTLDIKHLPVIYFASPSLLGGRMFWSIYPVLYRAQSWLNCLMMAHYSQFYLFLEKILHFQFHWILIERLMMWRSRHWYTFCFLIRPYRGKTEEISWEVPPLINTLFRGSTLLGKTEEITWETYTRIKETIFLAWTIINFTY